MQQLHDPMLLKYYIDKYQLQNYFSFDLAATAVLLQYEANEMFCRAGELVPAFLILVDGECIAYTITSTDKIHCEAYYRGPNFMGLTATLWKKPAINDIKAITPCKLLSFPAERYRSILLNDAKFLRYAVESLASHIRNSAAHFEPVETRLATFILETEENQVFHYNLTLCADLVEPSYRHLLRVLHSFCEMGILDRTGKSSYNIIDREQLEQISHGQSML